MSINKHTNPAYISHVHLKGYKSIIDTEVELHPGLNIIIGPNGSGKTNFLEFLNTIILLKFKELPNGISGGIQFYFKNNKKSFKYTFKRNYKLDDTSKEIKEEFLEKLEGDDLEPMKHTTRGISFLYTFPNWKEFHPVILKFGLPDRIQNLSKSLSIIGHPLFAQSDEFLKATYYDFDPELSFGLEKILKDIFDPKIFEEYNVRIVSDNYIDDVEINLGKFSPIKKIRIMPSLDLVKDNSGFRADYLNFEFLVSEKWLKWNQLSDGTKRLFYIISEVTMNDGLCFIEEPEIGVHPDQYAKILTFLKEQAEDKQIIISTHAPRSLDILKDNELDRIILTRYDKDKGTKMRHLSEEEIKQAIEYKEEEGSASELWTYTGFFDEEEVI